MEAADDNRASEGLHRAGVRQYDRRHYTVVIAVQRVAYYCSLVDLRLTRPPPTLDLDLGLGRAAVRRHSSFEKNLY